MLLLETHTHTHTHTHMQDEIFGPILPILTVSDVDEAVKFVNKREKPLAFYVFTESSRTFQSINDRTSAGGVVRNDTLMHGASKTLWIR